MRRQFGDSKISRRTEGPEGDFVCTQTLFAWDLFGYKQFKIQFKIGVAVEETLMFNSQCTANLKFSFPVTLCLPSYSLEVS